MAKWFEVRTDGTSTNSGGFDKDSNNLISDLFTSTGTSSTPIVSSNSYSFRNEDIGHWLYIRSTSIWRSGFYQITGLAGTSAVVNAGIGSCVKISSVSGFQVLSPFGPATVAGVGTSGFITSGQWAIDYTQSATARTTANDLIVSSTVTRVYSPSYIFSNSDIGNSIKIYSGTGWTLGLYYITGIAGTMANISASPGIAGTSGASFSLGGAVNHPNFTTIGQQDGGMFVRAGTYTTTSAGHVSGNRVFIWGYNSLRGDAPKGDDRPLFLATIPNSTVIAAAPAAIMNSFAYLRVSGNGFTNVNAFNFSNSRNQIMFCKASDCNVGFNPSNMGLFLEAYNCITGFSGGAVYGCVAVGCTTGFSLGLGLNCGYNIAIGCTTGFSTADSVVHNCIAHNCVTGFVNNNLGHCYVSCIGSSCRTYAFNVNGLWNTRFISCASFASTNYSTGGYADWDLITNLTQIPFVDPNNFDFRLNDLPGGGALLKGRGGYGGIINMPQSVSFEDPGILQGSRKIFFPNMSGGIGG